MKKRTLQASAQTLAQGLEKFLFDCKVRNLSPRTVEFYHDTNRRFIVYKGDILVSKVKQKDVQGFILYCSGEGMEAGGINANLRGVRAFFNYLRLKIEVKPIKQQQKTIIPFDEQQIKAMLNLPDRKTFVGLRDYTIMSLLIDTGMRISEVAKICRKDIFPSGQIIVTGKGDKERVVPIGRACQKMLSEYLEHVYDIPADKPIFVSVYNNPLNRHSFNARLKRYGELAGITNVRVSCHTFRHTFAKLYLLNGGDQFSLQDILGHETMEMVRKYVKLFASDLKEQHRKYSPADNLLRIRKR